MHDIASLVKDDIEIRVQKGEIEYGERLRPHNGRDALRDAYEEALDLCMYLRQVLYERDAQTAVLQVATPGGLRETTPDQVSTLIQAALDMPRSTPEAGGAGTSHRYDIVAAQVWALDAALRAIGL